MSVGWIEMRVQVQNPNHGTRKMCYKQVQICDEITFNKGDWDALLNNALEMLSEQVLSEFAKPIPARDDHSKD